tara:strand:- start:622 stop:810 length:189 start_codon:yes stop_codon:yes gene_type:complete
MEKEGHYIREGGALYTRRRGIIMEKAGHYNGEGRNVGKLVHPTLVFGGGSNIKGVKFKHDGQ